MRDKKEAPARTRKRASARAGAQSKNEAFAEEMARTQTVRADFFVVIRRTREKALWRSTRAVLQTLLFFADTVRQKEA